MNADLLHAPLARPVVQNPFNYRLSGMLQYARLLQLVLIVQQSVHEFFHLDDQKTTTTTKKPLFIPETSHKFATGCCLRHLYDSDFAVVLLYGAVEILHHLLELLGLFVDFGRIRQVGQERIFLLCYKKI